MMVQSLMKHKYIQILLVSAGTAVAGEFKINPFDGDIFRIGLGSSVFLLFLLLFRHLPYIVTGIATGIFVLLFRTMLDMAAGDGMAALQILGRHCSAMVYYIVFALCMSLIKRRLDTFHPLVLGGVAALIDLMSNEMELVTRMLLLGTSSFHMSEWTYLMAIAMLRTYFTTGIYSSISVSQMRIIQKEQTRRIEQMLGFGSGLYGEVFYLRKSIDTLENVTLNSYELYRSLKEDGLEPPQTRQVLDITQQIHEVKKDSQRILAGLIKLVDREVTGDMPLSGIIRFTVKSNAKYAEMLGKRISFGHHISPDYTTDHYIPLLTLLNNLTANAVEAIKEQGTVSLGAYEKGEFTVFTVTDSGGGVKERDREHLFEPGFTTKFDEEGVAATGIGLSHVRDIVESFGGEIAVGAALYTGGAMFTVKIPTAKLRKEE
jgi:two-component system, sensor histidine kinase YcbA